MDVELNSDLIPVVYGGAFRSSVIMIQYEVPPSQGSTVSLLMQPPHPIPPSHVSSDSLLLILAPALHLAASCCE